MMIVCVILTRPLAEGDPPGAELVSIDREVDMPDERFVATVVTRQGKFQGRKVTLVAWGMHPRPFLVVELVEGEKPNGD